MSYWKGTGDAFDRSTWTRRRGPAMVYYDLDDGPRGLWLVHERRDGLSDSVVVRRFSRGHFGAARTIPGSAGGVFGTAIAQDAKGRPAVAWYDTAASASASPRHATGAAGRAPAPSADRLDPIDAVDRPRTGRPRPRRDRPGPRLPPVLVGRVSVPAHQALARGVLLRYSGPVTREIQIRGGMIRLGALLKVAGVIDAGGEARPFLAENPGAGQRRAGAAARSPAPPR